ncbi:YiiX/YebB-like N1pC/P60 family cysteine hydrolase [Bdellovibrio sp. KM01]|uniref:YiiX/YebB-like N1pC/P60 family cysteine hydrolase n=1 Tax=Bdellovibrio sp. KM01 TaxID=2748865 RepID=UPI0015EA5F9B|nr:YiiX/YebB-like N1pC/P60 family cysteine hydrolase [Bdellovibrio sp. KM01]QLY24716.1 hypothetical protein HW988_14850 [Bdellovibrio sp. KM01]
MFLRLKFCLGVLLIFILSQKVFAAPSTDKANEKTTFSMVISGIDQVLQDLGNDKVFNPQTCPTYINKITDWLFYLPADQLVPHNPQEIAFLKTNGDSVIRKIFLLRLKLHERLKDFDKANNLTEACVLKIREGLQYARFTNEYITEWIVHNKVVAFEEAPILAGSFPFVLKDPSLDKINLIPGDVLLIRGKSFVSAMIARIGDEEGNFSHLAIVGQDDKGGLQVVESLIQEGVVVTPLEKWRNAQDARVALFRLPDQNLAEKAARLVYEWGLTHAEYDFAMDDSRYDRAFCSEVVRYAFDKASDGKLIVPKYRSHVSKFKDGPYPKSLGVTQATLFAPYDIEVDPRFQYLAEGTFYPLLRQVRIQDSILQSIYEWMIKKDYTFYEPWWLGTEATLGKGLRFLGFMKDQMPTYMPKDTIKTILLFEGVSDSLEKNLFDKEKAFYEKRGYPPSFQDMMLANEQKRKEDCALYEKGKKSEFHSFFRGKGCN